MPKKRIVSNLKKKNDAIQEIYDDRLPSDNWGGADNYGCKYGVFNEFVREFRLGVVC